jgi:hypothetical protein
VVDTTIDRHIQVPRKKAHHPITTGNAIMLEAFGETKSVVDWARDARSRVAANTIYARIRSKWEPEEAITTPPSGNLVSKMKEASGRLFEAYGESKPMTAWLKDPKCEVSYAALWRRLNKGIPFEQALKSNRPNPSGSDLLRLGSKPLDAFGESKSLREWLNDPRCEIREVSLRVKLKQGIPLEQALRKSKIGPRKK